MKIKLKKITNNTILLKKAPTGFSATCFFFGFFPPIFRGDLKYFAIMLILAFLTFGLSGLVFPFIYNKMYIKDLLNKGYEPATAFSEEYLKKEGFIA